jgi:hypothetical protein
MNRLYNDIETCYLLVAMERFLSTDNIRLLWDVIVDEGHITRESMQYVSELFNNNINGFYNVEKTKCKTIVEMNKKYIMLILNHVRKPRANQNLNRNDSLNKIVIHEPAERMAITFEEIQEDRRSQFDKDYSKLQDNFNSAMAPNPPPTPNFGDIKDTPMNEMELALKKITEQRNYDIDQINKNHEPKRSVSWSNTTEVNLFDKLKPIVPDIAEQVALLDSKIEAMNRKLDRLMQLLEK